jgi:hypothetical protein
VAFVVYAVLALSLFGAALFADGTRECVCIGGDEQIFVWAFAWWPHALLHGLNPFDSHIIYAPQGFDIAHGALVPAAALLMAPVTAIAGPLFAYNVAMLLCPVLAAFFAFLLCRWVTRSFWPSLFGGWVFGFSTYMLGQLAGHMHLTLVFLIPAIVHLVLRALAGEIRRRWFVVLLIVALTLQFGFSAEVFVSLTLFGAVAYGLAVAFGDRRLRDALRGLLGPIALAYAVTAVIVAPYLYYALRPGGLPILLGRTDMFSNDVLAFVTPLPDVLLGGSTFASASNSFTAGWIEGGAYFGLPLLAMMVLGAVQRWSRVDGKVMVLTLAVVVVCSLGGHLAIGGPTSIPLPWAVAHRLPILGLMLPSRFVVYGFLIGAILASMWLAQSGARVLPIGLAALSIIFLWPATGHGYWRSTPDLPSLFTASRYRSVITARDTVLVLPIGGVGNGMLWQAEAGLRFKLAGGYVVPPEAPDPYKRDPIYPTLLWGATVPDQERAAQQFLSSHGVTVAALDPRSPQALPWLTILPRLGWRAQAVGGALVLRRRS